MRIGQGYDVHRLEEGLPLIVGGVRIPYPKGLKGHSDADVLLHAVTDALLGAAGEGDIGSHFPDTDERWKGIDSRKLLRQSFERVKKKGYEIGNVDATIIAQKPKMAPYIPEMRRVIAETLDCDPDRVNVKATTTERLGFTGREEGLAALAVVLLKENTIAEKGGAKHE